MSLRNDERFLTILSLISEANLGGNYSMGLFARYEDIVEEIGDKDTVEEFINALLDLGYIRCINDKYVEKVGRELGYKAYQITAQGKIHLQTRVHSSSISVGDNSNFAWNSPHATQTIHIDSLDLDLQQKIAEMQEAAKKGDASTLKKTFGYIADKSVDVAIALLTGRLLQ